jgi:hypothetical protein
MATTAKGTPYVESSDLVADYPTVSLALAEHIDDFGGKVLQVVRATDATDRTITSSSLVDISGLTVTITPQKNTSAVILISTLQVFTGTGLARLTIADSANNPISGAQDALQSSTNIYYYTTLVAYATPATTSAVTYKVRGRTAAGTLSIFGTNSASQMYAIEVSA